MADFNVTLRFTRGLPMRLTPDERRTIALLVEATFPAGTTVALFGSRVDDMKRGGDIDLLVETPRPLEPADLVRRRSVLVAGLYKALEEQRIDVLVVARGAEAGSAIVDAAREHGIALAP